MQKDCSIEKSSSSNLVYILISNKTENTLVEKQVCLCVSECGGVSVWGRPLGKDNCVDDHIAAK